MKHAFENLEDSAKDGIIEELLNRGETVFADVAKNQWGSYCVQHSKFDFSFPNAFQLSCAIQSLNMGASSIAAWHSHISYIVFLISPHTSKDLSR